MATKLRGTQLEDNPAFSGSAGMVVPTGATADRAASPVAGTLRGNTTLGTGEMYIGGSWVPFGYANSSLVLQARRSTTYPMTTTAAVITLDNSDVTSNSSLLYRDTTNTNRLYAALAGLYEVTFSGTLIETNNGTTDLVYVSKNGTTTVPGSSCSVSTRNATSVLSRHFYVTLAANDYLTLMGSKSGASGTGVVQTDLTICIRKV